jgi:hypothetical protein
LLQKGLYIIMHHGIFFVADTRVLKISSCTKVVAM